jgi:hypothetical protein
MKKAARGLGWRPVGAAKDGADREGARAADEAGSVFSVIRVSIEAFGE